MLQLLLLLPLILILILKKFVFVLIRLHKTPLLTFLTGHEINTPEPGPVSITPLNCVFEIVRIICRNLTTIPSMVTVIVMVIVIAMVTVIVMVTVI